jgi:hypothetical protein
VPVKTKCACGNEEFEAGLVELKNSTLAVTVAQCAKCGKAIGVLESWEHPQITDFIKDLKPPVK